MLRHFYVGMTEHFRHILNAYTIGEAHRGRIRVPGCVRGQALSYATQIGYLFQVAVHLLIAGDREQYIFLLASRMAFVFLQNLHRNIEQRDVAHILRLLARLANPIIAVVVLNDMFGR